MSSSDLIAFVSLFGIAASISLGGCSFESGLGGAKCDQEGARQGHHVCRGGYWVALDAGTGPVDGTVTEECEPSGEESCNGRDDDCDGTVDEGCSCDDWTDRSGGACDLTGTIGDGGECEPPPEYAEEEGGENGCGDNLDNDCDGEVDESCNCVPGESRPCYTGPEETEDVGACQGGMQSCDGGEWGECEGEVVPEEESGENCGNGEDDDCDGVVDEGCPCNYQGNSDGVCGEQTRDESGNCPKPDLYQQETDEERCDEVDNDCDGVEDEGCPCNYLEYEEGVCGSSTIQLDGSCAEPDDFIDRTSDESAENKCDQKDNDCDGETDEGCSCTPGDEQDCYSGPSGTAGEGICEKGAQECNQDGEWGSCTGEQTPEVEQCDDGLDNDCDGVEDEGCLCDYDGNSEGVCEDQIRSSDGTCPEPMEYESDETICDGLDNDCDGQVDENLSRDCSKQSGVCSGATVSCQNGSYPTCDGTQYGSDYEDTEGSCGDDLDNDCDGDTDCADGDCTGVRCAGSGTACVSDDKQCHETACNDGLDNDGDGAVDACDTDCSADCGSGATCNNGVCEETDCGDGDDNDGDGDTDCEDDDCTGAECNGSGSQCVSGDDQCHETACNDGVDNDGDGDVDACDSDCTADCGSGATCNGGVCEEIDCGDGDDNDGDGDTDCEDDDCTGVECDGSGTACRSGDDQCHETACSDGEDNDGDGDIDACDSDCTTDCGSGASCNNGECEETDCGDGSDNDGDGDTDCEDDDCNGVECNGSGSQCVSGDDVCHETACNDGDDNDGDGFVDCGDDDCRSSGNCNQRIFVTSDTFSPGDSPPNGFSSLSQADTLCNDVASAAGLSGTWGAVLSHSSTDAIDRIDVTGAIHNLDGDKVADDEADLWNQEDGHLDNAVEFDETVQSRDVDVWTGTDEDGTVHGTGGHCSDWSSSSATDTGETGSSGSSSGDWISTLMDSTCDADAHLYCIDGQ